MDALESSDTPERLAIPRAAVDYMTVYILGCQPEVAAYNFSGLSPVIKSDLEPDNAGYYGFGRALDTLDSFARAKRLSEVAVAESLIAVTTIASNRAYRTAEEANLRVPLKPPVLFREMDERVWGYISHLFIDPKDEFGRSLLSPERVKLDQLPPETKAWLDSFWVGVRRYSLGQVKRLVVP